jgi:hypothetical protein
VYTHNGAHDDNKFNRIWKEFDPENTNELRFIQLVAMILGNRNLYDCFGVMAAMAEWGLLFLLVANRANGFSIRKEDVKAQYDGRLFYTIEERRKQ